MTTARQLKSQKWFNHQEFPFGEHFFQIDGKWQMHYVDEGEGEIILFVHGTPLWTFENRNLIKAFSKTHRCIAPDHIGFGLSDKPKDYNYTAQQHAENLERFIDHLDVDKITLVVHDFGGPIGLNYALKNPQKIRRLVVFNTWMWSQKDDPEYKKFEKIIKSPLVPFLYKYLNFSPKILIPKSIGKAYKLEKWVHRHYCKPFRNAGERLGTLGFRNALLKEQDWFESLWAQRAKIASKPSLFIWGMQDPYVRPNYLEKFENSFENHSSIRLEDVGHLVAEEASESVIEAMRVFLHKF